MRSYAADNLEYYLRDPEKVEAYNSSGGLDEVEIRHAYVIPEERKNKKPAISWASWVQSEPNIWVPDGSKTVDMIKVPNDPIVGGRVIGISERGNGGRAIQVIINVSGMDVLVDMREAEFYPELMINGIQPGGFLEGEFAWIMNSGGHMSLIRHGTERWEAAVEGAKVRKQKPIKSSKLKIGNVYSTVSGKDRLLYLGRVKNPIDGKKSWVFIGHNWYVEHEKFVNLEKSYKDSFKIAFNYTPYNTIGVPSSERCWLDLRPSCPNFVSDHGAADLSEIMGDFVDDISDTDSITAKIQEKVDENYLQFLEAVEYAKATRGPTYQWGRPIEASVSRPGWF